ncbi:RDD family protein [Sediminihabitans luteus]|uniref:RDD family protein n=1 Tax=Sediminihabitans luteus TaxID=1138585 RepID=A0A2M9CQ43_9CELL|nr:RDD family protein [Sediminihabitans luteus]PJJ74009.1 RDD family protein [Sediminihabitans luteus]GII98076.1 RDD family protein [Sediminihabitans luteus]
MASREDLGSWLDGTPRDPDGGHGVRLGLPAQGPGSLATLGPRVGGLVVDWVVATLVAYVLTGGGSLLEVPPGWQLGVFAGMTFLLVATVGGTLGHRLLGMQVRVLGAPRGAVGLWRAAVRTVLLCLVIPAVVWDRDGRGVHDRAAGTVLLRTR